MKIEFFNFQLLKDFSIPQKQFSNVLENLFDLDFSINVVFLKKADIKQLNFQFRNIEKSTDVLAFGPYDCVGEVYVCPDFMRQEKKDFEKEVVRIVIHGILHLQGYDHEKYFDENEITEGMYVLQEKYLKKFYDIFRKK